MNSAILATLAAVGFGLAVGLMAAASEAPDLHALARAFARRTSSLAQRLAARAGLSPTGISARVVAALRYEIRSLAAAAAVDGPSRADQEKRLSAACGEVASRLAADARGHADAPPL